MKKLVALVLAALMVLSLAACDNGGTDASKDASQDAEKKLKVGFIYLHDENSTYDKNFMDAAKEACEKLGVEYVEKTNIKENNDCYEAALDLVDSGCNIIFADSFGHEDYMIKAAKEHPEVVFCHATGTKAHTEGLKNYHNAFASIYEGRYLAGVVAGLKLNEMIEDGKITPEEAVIGYVGAFTYAEVISGYTSFFLGARSQCPTATMHVLFTGSWYDETLEKEAATSLINTYNCVLISQHADSMGAPSVCEQGNIPNVSYNGSTISQCPNTFLVSSRIDWAPYYEYIITCVKENKEIGSDYTGTLADGSVKFTDLNTAACAEGTQAIFDQVKAELLAGTRKVFDTDTFTVNGEKVNEYKADVDFDTNYEKDTDAVSDGYFHESEYRSAPYFDLWIDGITLDNTKFG